jgi:hypothetical protein
MARWHLFRIVCLSFVIDMFHGFNSDLSSYGVSTRMAALTTFGDVDTALNWV